MLPVCIKVDEYHRGSGGGVNGMNNIVHGEKFGFDSCCKVTLVFCSITRPSPVLDSILLSVIHNKRQTSE